LDHSGSGWGPIKSSCERGNEPSGSVKRWEYLECLYNWQLPKKGSAPWVSEWVSESVIRRNINRHRLQWTWRIVRNVRNLVLTGGILTNIRSLFSNIWNVIIVTMHCIHPFRLWNKPLRWTVTPSCEKFLWDTRGWGEKATR
jgi:hypothetical protein